MTALSSPQGKVLFKEALATNGMESYFPLAEQFVTQSEPSFCSLSSLSMVLNALNFDPKKIWKGLWRWVSEETLQCESTRVCGHSLERIKTDGLSFMEFESLARCHGVKITSHRVFRDEHGNIHDETSHDGIEAFRSLVERISSDDRAETFIVVNYSRKVLGQTGDGHFSPIGGYHKDKELVLILDVARFKYPPYWVPLQQLWEAMAEQDRQTQQPRGYFVVSGWNTRQLQEDPLEAEVSFMQSIALSHSHAHDHNGHCIEAPTAVPQYNSPGASTVAGAGGLHRQQRSGEHSRLTSATAYATVGTYCDSISVGSTTSSSSSSGAGTTSVCTHSHDHSHDHSHSHNHGHYHSHSGHVLHHVSTTIAAKSTPLGTAAVAPPVTETPTAAPVIKNQAAAPVAPAASPAVSQTDPQSPHQSQSQSQSQAQAAPSQDKCQQLQAKFEAARRAAAVAVATCPPMIRTWQDFKRYIPRNMCQSKPAPGTGTGTGTGTGSSGTSSLAEGAKSDAGPGAATASSDSTGRSSGGARRPGSTRCA